ncbi:hypothetical protein GB931_07000 [Modestobacter sp. I12A-02628]|uniref:DUF308 domain-containing protein n=1 Tax=Goekera deserti TaxID=2497753 RepID=A0A7K3WD86_9ACTN|nr:DUF308 domain-containing protein [Goekera deserti]MPQ97671.1 hypothetical protein [Goekera deserti]NDI47725.1 hypothetical protein [Goekera deserti]NEL53473.1 DUF308 domain-containing protein [Goekera deserti]
MSSPRRARGRRDNGLDAALWSPLRDVDPRVGEHLLDVLREEGIAAYLDPSAHVDEYTRTVFLPSPPSDRLFVDRSQRSLARQVVEQHADDHADAPTAPPAPALDAGLDHEAEWARIVAGYEAEHGRTPVEHGEPDVARGEPAADAVGSPPRPAAPAHREPAREPARDAAEELRPLEWAAPPEEHFEPPPPPPLSAPAPASLYACLLIALGVLLVFAPGLLRVSGDAGILLGVLALVGGVTVLVSRMRDRDEDDDDGAVV